MTVGDLGTEINPKFEGISAGFEIRAGGEFENNLEQLKASFLQDEEAEAEE